MGVKPDRWIRKMALEKGMIEPFESNQVSKGVVSFGTSAYGYDMRLGTEFHLPELNGQKIIDPKNKDSLHYNVIEAEEVVVPAHGSVLARSLEYFRIPRDVLVFCFGKSTYARCGIMPHITPLEPEWEGVVTIKIFNVSPFPVRLHAREGIAQVVFVGADEICQTSYKDKGGKYQDQTKVTHAKIAS
jgi:dCTP deaminase